MGKSSKKVKSDRINALRKQYDVFLEEDKRRKDRNEYILGWLDRVRACPTIPSIQMQEKPFETYQTGISKGYDYSLKYQAAASCPINIKPQFFENLDDTLILKEVSKKYILIPKKSSDSKDDCNMYRAQQVSGINHESDWKSKYNILNELKQNEKEEQYDKVNKEKLEEYICDIPKKDENISATTIPIDMNIKNKDELAKYKVIEPKKYKEVIDDAFSNEQNIQGKKDNDFNINHNTIPAQNNLNTSEVEFDTKILQDSSEKMPMISNVNDLLTSARINYNEIDTKPVIQADEIKEYQSHWQNLLQENIEINQEEIKCATLPQSKTFITNKNQNKYEDPPESTLAQQGDTYYITSSQSNKSPAELTEIVKENNNESQNQQFKTQENIVTTNETINSGSTETKDATLPEVNSKYQPECESSNLVEDNQTQIQEFEAEQNELFYSENPNDNYTYNEEHVAENYENNEQYSYYEATTKDPNHYGTEVNEHEESTDRYDPHYEQQYENSYEGNLPQNEYPTEEYTADQNLEYQQRQYYENYEVQQLDNNIVPEQQQYEHTAYITSDVEQHENINNSHNQELNSGEITSTQIDTLEHNMEQQLNIEDGYAADQTRVMTDNEVIATSAETEEVVQGSNLKSK